LRLTSCFNEPAQGMAWFSPIQLPMAGSCTLMRQPSTPPGLTGSPQACYPAELAVRRGRYHKRCTKDREILGQFCQILVRYYANCSNPDQWVGTLGSACTGWSAGAFFSFRHDRVGPDLHHTCGVTNTTRMQGHLDELLFDRRRLPWVDYSPAERCDRHSGILGTGRRCLPCRLWPWRTLAVP
jgi:hypothetical protein